MSRRKSDNLLLESNPELQAFIDVARMALFAIAFMTIGAAIAIGTVGVR